MLHGSEPKGSWAKVVKTQSQFTPLSLKPESDVFPVLRLRERSEVIMKRGRVDYVSENNTITEYNKGQNRELFFYA